MEMTYDYACSLTPGHFVPPGFHAVSSCNFFAFMHYANNGIHLYQPPTSPKGTGAGAHPKAVTGVRFDLTRPMDWSKTYPVEARPEPAEPDHRIMITLGLNGPVYSQVRPPPPTPPPPTPPIPPILRSVYLP
jgi:hypothetical protein